MAKAVQHTGCVRLCHTSRHSSNITPVYHHSSPAHDDHENEMTTLVYHGGPLERAVARFDAVRPPVREGGSCAWHWLVVLGLFRVISAFCGTPLAENAGITL